MSVEIYDYPQRSKEWFDVRKGIPTASEAKTLLGGKVGFEGYAYKKYGELHQPKPIISNAGAAAERGKNLEPEAIEVFTERTLIKIEKVGFLLNKDLYLGCSPDGMASYNGEKFGTEIKCFSLQKQSQMFLTRKVDKDTYQQVQLSLAATNLKMWLVIYYNPDLDKTMDLVVIPIMRDDDMIKEIKDRSQIVKETQILFEKQNIQNNEKFNILSILQWKHSLQEKYR